MGHQFLGRFGAVHVFRDPVERLQVAQPALALFHIGFDHVPLAALFLVPLVAFGELGFDEIGGGVLEEVLPEPGIERSIELRVAGQVAVFQKGRADRVVVTPELQAVAHAAGGVAHLQVQVPEHVEHRLDHRVGAGVGLARDEEQEIHVGIGRHLAPAVAADSDDGDRFGFRAGRRMEPFGGDIEHRPDDAVGEIGVGPCRRAGGARGVGKGRFDPVPAPGHVVAQAVDGGRPGLLFRHAGGDRTCDVRRCGGGIEKVGLRRNQRLGGVGAGGVCRR